MSCLGSEVFMGASPSRGVGLLCQSSAAFAALQHWTPPAPLWQAGSPAGAAMTDPRLADLGARIPSLRLLTELADLIHYGRDWTRRWGPSPLAVALPGTGEEVQAIVRWANEHGV